MMEIFAKNYTGTCSCGYDSHMSVLWGVDEQGVLVETGIEACQGACETVLVVIHGERAARGLIEAIRIDRERAMRLALKAPIQRKRWWGH
jgi:hypothetical protein